MPLACLQLAFSASCNGHALFQFFRLAFAVPSLTLPSFFRFSSLQITVYFSNSSSLSYPFISFLPTNPTHPPTHPSHPPPPPTNRARKATASCRPACSAAWRRTRAIAPSSRRARPVRCAGRRRRSVPCRVCGGLEAWRCLGLWPVGGWVGGWVWRGQFLITMLRGVDSTHTPIACPFSTQVIRFAPPQTQRKFEC